MKMAKQKIPSGIQVSVDANVLSVSGPKGKLAKKFDSNTVSVTVGSGEVDFDSKLKKVRKVLACVNSVEAHFRNMVKGVQEGFEKKMQVIYSHFPVTVEVKGKEVLIKNFLGEKSPRVAKVIGETKVTAKGADISISGPDKEDVGQTAANLSLATKIRKKDVRVFQDGIYYETA
ncbi:50S ribosomal protein L6 [Candidatus Micrarchaeota archaeon]|nr:50S ribosomal protein L6 [Candidatus Micrarchaeota archaeon]